MLFHFVFRRQLLLLVLSASTLLFLFSRGVWFYKSDFQWSVTSKSDDVIWSDVMKTIHKFCTTIRKSLIRNYVWKFESMLKRNKWLEWKSGWCWHLSPQRLWSPPPREGEFLWVGKILLFSKKILLKYFFWLNHGIFKVPFILKNSKK